MKEADGVNCITTFLQVSILWSQLLKHKKLLQSFTGSSVVIVDRCRAHSNHGSEAAGCGFQREQEMEMILAGGMRGVTNTQLIMAAATFHQHWTRPAFLTHDSDDTTLLLNTLVSF